VAGVRRRRVRPKRRMVARMPGVRLRDHAGTIAAIASVRPAPRPGERATAVGQLCAA
jgi:hypothetical protein